MLDAYDQISSSDDYYVKLAIPYKEFDAIISDIDEKEMEAVGRCYDVEHLSPGSFSSPAFPVNGRIFGLNVRFMVPLICQDAIRPNSRAVNIWFLVNTSSPYTCLTVKSLDALFDTEDGPRDVNRFYELAIQDQQSQIECRTSKGHFSEVNILGADAIIQLNLSIKLVNEGSFQLIRL